MTSISRYRTPRPNPARLNTQDELLQLLFACYARDQAFGKALDDLAWLYRAAIRKLVGDGFSRWTSQFLDVLATGRLNAVLGQEVSPAAAKLSRLLDTSGLRRIPDDVGAEALRVWFAARLDAHFRHSNIPIDESFFGRAVGTMYYSPPVGELVMRLVYEFEISTPFDPLEGVAVALTEGVYLPIVAPPPPEYWDADTVAKPIARREILKQWSRHLDAELDRIETEYRRAGRVFADTASMTEQYVEWLYRRLALRHDCDTIAESASTSTGNVSNKTTELARMLGVRLPRKQKSHRFD